MRQTLILFAVLISGALAWLDAPELLTVQAAGQLPQGLKDPPLGVPGGATRQTPGRGEVEFLDPQQTTIPAHRSTPVELRFRIAKGLHINSHTPLEKTLIPTRLAVTEQSGFDVTDVDFPPGTDYTLALAPQEKLSVYTGDFILRAHITAQPGVYLLRGALRYQACNVNSCMPPRTLPFEVGILAK